MISTLIILAKATLEEKIHLFFKTFYTSFDSGLTQKQLKTLLVIGSKSASIIHNVKHHCEFYINIADWLYRKFVRDYKEHCKRNNRNKEVLFNIHSKFDIITITEWIKQQGDIVELLLTYNTSDAATVRKCLTIQPTIINSLSSTVLQSEHLDQLSNHSLDEISVNDDVQVEQQSTDGSNIQETDSSKLNVDSNTTQQIDNKENLNSKSNTNLSANSNIETTSTLDNNNDETLNDKKSISSPTVLKENIKMDEKQRKVTIETGNVTTIDQVEFAPDGTNEQILVSDVQTLSTSMPAIQTLKDLDDDVSSIMLLTNDYHPIRYGGLYSSSKSLTNFPQGLTSSKSMPCLYETFRLPPKRLMSTTNLNSTTSAQTQNSQNTQILPFMLHPANIQTLKLNSSKSTQSHVNFQKFFNHKRNSRRKPWRETTNLQKKKDLVPTKRQPLNNIMQLKGLRLKKFIEESREIQKCHRISPLFRNMQIKQLKLNFDLLDTDHSNDLTISELSDGFPTIKPTIERIFKGCDTNANHSVTFREFLSILFKSATQEENDQIDWVLNGPCTITDIVVMHLSELYNAIDAVLEPDICDSVPFSDLIATMVRCDELFQFVSRWNRFERSHMTESLPFEQTLRKLFPHYSKEHLQEYASFVHRPRIVQLTKDQESDIKKLFMYVDLDNSGTVSYEELRHLMDQHDLNMSEGIVHSIFRYMSQDPETDIGFDEFRSFFQYAWTFCEEPLTTFLSNVKTDPLYYTS